MYRVGFIPPRILTIREQEHGSPVRFGESDRARLEFYFDLVRVTWAAMFTQLIRSLLYQLLRGNGYTTSDAPGLFLT